MEKLLIICLNVTMFSNDVCCRGVRKCVNVGNGEPLPLNNKSATYFENILGDKWENFSGGKQYIRIEKKIYDFSV